MHQDGASCAPAALLVTSGLVGHHVRDMQRTYGFWFFYAGEAPA